MASQLDATPDVPVAPVDNTSGAHAMLNEVSNDRTQGKTNDLKPADQGQESKINATFGSLTIVCDDSKDSTGGTKATGDTVSASDSTKPAADNTTTQPADGTKTTGDVTATLPAEGTKAAGDSTTSLPADQTGDKGTLPFMVPDDKIAAGTSPSDSPASQPSDTAAPKDSPTLPFQVPDNAPATPVDTAKPAGDTPTPAPDTAKPAGDTASPAGDSAKPAGDSASPAGDSAKPAGDTAVDQYRDVAKRPDEIDIDAVGKLLDDPQVKVERKHLNDDITQQQKGLDKNSDEYKRLQTMRENMDNFESRATSQNPPLSPEEVAKTYKSVSHMMETKDGTNVLKQHDRVDAAEQVMLHAADPTTVDQGNHETCNVSTVESRMFTRNPSAAANLIDQVSTTGEYHTPGDNSVTVKVPPDSLQRTGPEESKPVPVDGQRSYASQIFQVTAVNLSHQTHDLKVTGDDGKEKVYPAGSVEYRQGKPDENAVPPTNGEGLYDKATGQIIKDNGKEVHAPSLEDGHLVDSYNMITGGKDSGFMIDNKENVSGDGKGVTQIGSEAELKSKIEEAQKDGKMPIILRVNTGQEPFYSDSGGGAAGGSGGAHVVTITGIDKDGKVQVENQWGGSSKHSVDMHELYIATMAPEQAIKALGHDAAENAKNGKVDYSTEAELLRLRHSDGDLQGKDADYNKELTWLTKSAVKDAVDHHDGQLDARTELELKQQVASQFDTKAKDGGAAFQHIKDQVWSNPLVGIMNGTGQVGLNDRGEKTTLPDNYDKLQTQSAAKDLYDAGNQYVYFNKDDYAKMDNALQGKSPAEIQQMDQQFKSMYGKSMEDYIKDRFSRHPEERDKALKLLHQDQTGNDQAAA